MCYFITIAVDEKHESTLRQKLRSSYTLSRSDNPSIRGNLKPQDVLFVIASGMCACDLFSRPQMVESENREERLRRKYSKPKYKKLGWTEARIERVIADSLSKPTNEFSGLRADLRWQLCDLAEDVGRVSIVVHFYSGDTETDEVPINWKKAITCEDLRDNDESVVEDTLVEVIS
jgi:hypothetical protein